MTEKVIAGAVDKVLKKRGETLDDIERANIILSLQKDLVGWGVLQPLVDNKEVTDIHVYDYKSVVLQRGKISESTVHARNARETLVRLESLLGRAQKSVAIDIIRQQIALAVDSIVWLIREKSTGKPRIAEVIEVGHFVEGQIQVRPMFTLIKQGQRPVWRVDSWTSNFDEQLKADGIHLGESPQEITFGNPPRPGATPGGRG